MIPRIPIDAAYKWLNSDTYWDIATPDPADNEPDQIIPPRPPPGSSTTAYPKELKQKYPVAHLSGEPRRSRLHDPEEPDLSIRTVLEQIVLQLRQEVDSGAWAAARDLIGQMNTVCQTLQKSPSTDSLQLAEARMEWGWAYWKMGEATKALEEFERCIKEFSGIDSHAAAVACWLTGYIQLETPKTLFQEGLVNWRACWKFFGACAADNRRPKAELLWYDRRAKLLAEDTQAVLAAGGITPSSKSAPSSTQSPTDSAPPPPSDQTAPPDSTPPPPASEPPPESAEPEPAEELFAAALLRFYNIDVYESIRAHPAGGFTQQASDSPIEVDRVLFDSRPHYLVSLKSAGVVFINPNESYSFVRVRGNSMNRAKPTPIADGDYVLLRIADRPEDGQIVAAVFKEDFPGASQSGLKRKRRDGLYSESTTPYGIVSLENVERYVGEVIAIAKPVRE